ncbi:glycosyltransferase [Rhizorhabdus phycosphaerae]|uniref:glycosyltransferase n=1 Tax=Rhizorhabdus phycosphaerae TaxID=2711156 RepID=UPI0013ED912F|nr:glycosyltransferase [Rhizorhabdus phycosphaerae]
MRHEHIEAEAPVPAGRPHAGGPIAAHIAIVMHDFSTGGSERIAIRLANRWAAAGRRVTIFAGVTEGPARALVAPSVTIMGMTPELPRSRLSRLRLGLGLADFVRSVQPDLLFVPGNFHIPVAAITDIMLGDQRPVIFCKLSNPLCRPGRGRIAQTLHGALLRWQARHIDRIIAMSPALAREARLVLLRDGITTIAEPNADEQDRACRPAYGPGRNIILCAGRLVTQKNVQLAIRAVAQVDRSLQAELLILGEGPLRAPLEALAADLGIGDQVRFGGYVRDLKPALRRAKLFLLTSLYEGYPAVVVEALVAGVPVISTACSPAIQEIIQCPQDGAIVAADVETIARTIEKRLRSATDVVSGPLLVERHRIDRIAKRYLDLFDQQIAVRQK